MPVRTDTPQSEGCLPAPLEENPAMFGDGEFDVLRSSHARIHSVFEKIAVDRRASLNSVYFCEHGLTREEVDELTTRLRSALEGHRLDYFAWANAHLPLIVAATEVGYSYEGNGTDFWPAFSQSVGHHFDFDDRHRLSGWFRRAAERFSGAVPGNSNWENAFCHIAWPISHAVAAKDIRRPFADSLRNFRGSIEDDDAQIAESLGRTEAARLTRRYRTWIGNQRLVAGIVREVLGGRSLIEAQLLTCEFRERLLEDLHREPEFSSAVRAARRSQRSGSVGKRATSSTTGAASEPTAIYGTFFLQRRAENEFELFGELPEMPRPVRQSLLRVCRCRRWRPRPWGFSQAAILSRGTLTAQRGTFPIEFRSVQRAEAAQPFFTKVANLGLDSDTAAWLEAIRFPDLDRIAFRPVDVDDDVCHAIIGRTPHQGLIWVVHSAADQPPSEEARLIGKLKSAAIHEFDASNALVREWLGWPAPRGTGSAVAPPARLIAPSPTGIGASGNAVFEPGDLIAVRSGSDKGVHVTLKRLSGDGPEQAGGELVLMETAQPGEYELTINEDGLAAQSFGFEFIAKGETDVPLPWEVCLRRVDGSVDAGFTRRDLFNHRLLLEITSPRAIENLRLGVSINPGQCEVAFHVDRLPQRVPSTHDVWKQLIDQLPESTVSSNCDLELTVSIEGLAAGTWRLEVDSPNVWWENDGQRLRAVGDACEFAIRTRNIRTGQLVAQSAIPGEPVVSVAHNSNGNPLMFDARVDVARESAWPGRLPKPARLLREPDDRDAGTGLRPTVERYLELACASSGSKAAELHRVGLAVQFRDRVLEVCCGDHWTRRSAAQAEKLDVEAISPVEVWWAVQEKHPVIVSGGTDEEQQRWLTLSSEFATRFANLCRSGGGMVLSRRSASRKPRNWIRSIRISLPTTVCSWTRKTCNVRCARRTGCSTDRTLQT